MDKDNNTTNDTSKQTAALMRFQQSLFALSLTLLALWLVIVSFGTSTPEAYLFPQMIATTMLALSIFALIRALKGGNRTGTYMDRMLIMNIVPGIIIIALYVFYLIEWLGFYFATSISIFLLISYYDPNPHSKLSSWFIRLVVATGFTILLWVVFAQGLRVHTPRGLWL